MKDQKIFILHAFTGSSVVEDVKLFCEALKELGCKKVISVLAIHEGFDVTDFTFHDFFKQCARTILDNDIVLTLDGWSDDKKAGTLKTIADMLEIPVQPADVFLRRNKKPDHADEAAADQVDQPQQS